MRLELDNLPQDPVLLHRLVREMADLIEHRDDEISRLQSIIKQLQRAHYGRRSERLDPGQLALALEDLDADLAGIAGSGSTAPLADTPPAAARRKPLPDHLSREDRLLDIETNACTCCGSALHAIGESVSEMLDWVPASLRVIRIRRPKYACRRCQKVVQAAAPDRVIAGGLASPALLAQVLVSKYCDHLPLYRQSQIFARQGVDLERSTLAGWVGGTCWWLEALYDRLSAAVLSSNQLFADDTPLPVLDPGRRRTKTGRLWVYARDQRGWAGTDPPAVFYVYEPDRRAARPKAHLDAFKGILQVDGYVGFEQVTGKGDVVLAACWAHARRKFYEIAKADSSPIAEQALQRIAEIYAVEAEIRGQDPVGRLARRQATSRPLVEAFHSWLETQLPRLPQSGKLAEAIRYALSRWTGLTRFLEDGKIELDTNPVERAIRPVALGRKNHLFAGSDRGARRWAIVSSLIETAKLNGVEPHAYLSDVLQRMAEGYPASRLDDLLPWKWKTKNPVKR
jgi:transposase